jgi:hypothetical protein
MRAQAPWSCDNVVVSGVGKAVHRLTMRAQARFGPATECSSRDARERQVFVADKCERKRSCPATLASNGSVEYTSAPLRGLPRVAGVLVLRRSSGTTALTKRYRAR